LIPFINDSRNSRAALLISLLWTVLAIPLDLRSELPGQVLRGSSQAQLGREKIPQKSIPVLLDNLIKLGIPAAGPPRKVLPLTAGVYSHMVVQ
jgi:hypothetical protein